MRIKNNLVAQLQFPKILILRIYEDDSTVLSFTNDVSKENINRLYKKLNKESKSKYFNKYELYINWYWIKIEE